MTGETTIIKLPTDLNQFQYFEKELEIQKWLLLEKAFSSSDPEQILTAQRYWKDIQQKQDPKEKSFLFDPYFFRDSLGYKAKPVQLSYNTLRNMARTPIINAIIGTRLEQVGLFNEPQTDMQKEGWMIRKKKSIYLKEDNQSIDIQDALVAERVTEFLMNCGVDSTGWHLDPFDVFLRKVTQDSLEIDQLVFEIIRNRKGVPVEFLAVDGSTFRLADSYDDKKREYTTERIPIFGYLPSYVQIYNGTIQEEFYPWELCFGIRNPSTSIYNNGYGTSELEILVRTVTAMLYSDTYNSSFFKQGSSPKGILKVQGGVGDGKIAEFRQEWQAQMSGPAGYWKTPVLPADKVEWIDLQKNNKDMEYGKWQEYLLKTACAVYKIDPSEIGFQLAGSQGGMVFDGNNKERLEYSRDKGLRPLLKFIQQKINKYIVNAIAPGYEFIFTGVNKEDEVAKLDSDIKRLGNFMGLKEIRRKNNLPDEIEPDDLILNSIWMQNKTQSMMGGQQSNQFVDQEEDPGSSIQGNPFMPTQQEDMEKAIDPFVKAYNIYLERLNEEGS